MTADYTQVGEESPREACANLAQIFRGEVMMRKHAKPIEDPDARWAAEVLTDQFANWASRLERAVQQLDAEQSPPGGPWRAVSHPSKESGELVHWIERPRNGKIRVLYFDSEAEAIAVRDALNKLGAVPPAEQDTPQ